MKKVFAAIPGVLAALHLLVPLVFLISVLNGGYLELYHPVFIAVISSVTSVAAVVVMLVFGERYGKWNGAALAATLLFDAVTQFYFTYHAVNVINGYDTAAPAIIALFGTVATLVMFVKCVEDSVFKAAIGVLSVLFSIVAAGIAIYALINTLAFGRTFYADGPDSPDGRYSVKITYRESGLISDGKSYVVLTDNNESGAFVGAIKRKPFDIYTGGALEYDRITIGWSDVVTVVINGDLYSAETGAKIPPASEPVTEESLPESADPAENVSNAASSPAGTVSEE